MKRRMLATLLGAAIVSATMFAGTNTQGSRTTGGGHYFITTLGLEMQFGFSAILNQDGGASGSFHHQGTLDGLAIAFHGSVTCVSFDPDNHRAWIGGVITANRSEHPSFLTTVHEVGHDIWFRVLDTGPGQAGDTPDRTTFVGFEGVIASSQEYCDTMPWPADNARTWPVAGNLTVLSDLSPVSLSKTARWEPQLVVERAGEMALVGKPSRRRDLRDR
jgi:hypothetical protein